MKGSEYFKNRIFHCLHRNKKKSDKRVYESKKQYFHLLENNENRRRTRDKK